jgi:hypothetical protein
MLSGFVQRRHPVLSMTSCELQKLAGLIRSQAGDEVQTLIQALRPAQV